MKKEILASNFCFRGVGVKKGPKPVIFRFQPLKPHCGLELTGKGWWRANMGWNKPSDLVKNPIRQSLLFHDGMVIPGG